ncbi:hypothetical protein AC578_7575 [Pseudocercospora eumusae]|uniref:UNC-45/Cro1/She4 central domain-containing protein n=1 Tax=Pseudocercospora eumusae TaxID=321146 RepID=A0A139HRQ5_9PEZI|nr:hypothetical protein AC578_7575 [Pseudocercospora eumusae]
MTSTHTAEDQISLDFTALSTEDTPKDRIDQAIARLVVASREQRAVRERLAAFLPLLVERLSKDAVPDATLRCIGNACADNQTGRDTITGIGFNWISQFLVRNQKSELRELAVQVLYNICKDHEASQKQCYRERVHYQLLTAWPFDAGEQVRDILLWITGHKAELEPTLEEQLPTGILHGLFDQLPQLHDGEDVEAVLTGIELVLVYLRDPIVQGQISELRLVERVLQMIKEYQDPFLTAAIEDKEDADLLKTQNANLVWCLSDVSANPEFVKCYSLEDEIISAPDSSILAHICIARGDICSGSYFIACCQIIGNLLWALSPESYASWAEEGSLKGFALHESLLDVLASASQATPGVEALHSIAGVLIQLSRPSLRARRLIGQSASALAAIEHLSRHERSEIRQDCVKLLKALGKDCRENQIKFGDLAQEVMLSLQQPPAPT